MNRTNDRGAAMVLPKTPSVPPEFEIRARPGESGSRTPARRVEDAQEMAHELRGSPGYADDFGRGAPPAEVVADSLDCAVAWTAERRKADAWAEYAREQEAACWKRARRILDGARSPFERARARDATIESRYPSTTRMLDAEDQVEEETTPISRRAVSAAVSRRPPPPAEEEAGVSADPVFLLMPKDEARMRKLNDELGRSHRGLLVHLDLAMLARD